MATLSRSFSFLNGYYYMPKLACFVIVLLSLAIAAKITVPATIKVFSYNLFRFREATRTWLAPPYLFITVHLIILVIWKLSDQMHHHHDTAKASALDLSSSSAENSSPERNSKVSASPLHGNQGEQESRIQSFQEITFDEKQVMNVPSDPSTLPIDFGITKKVSGSVTESQFAVSVVELGNESMEDTWKAIMEKSSGGDSDVGVQEDSDELLRRCDDFIRKKYDQMRLQK